MTTIKIQPEYSAQATHSKPNRFVKKALEKLYTDKQYSLKTIDTLVDLGCGKLRHLNILREYSKNIFLVDTKFQIERRQKFGDILCTMHEYLESVISPDETIKEVETKDFEKQQNNVDAVFSIGVMPVVLEADRKQMLHSAYRNLRPGGYFVVIIPRNDSSILKNCTPNNKIEDGYYFKNRGHEIYTFYINFRDPSTFLALIEKKGFQLIEDLSVYRQIYWIFQKPE
jgi:SAM-dependent methyltransferase